MASYSDSESAILRGQDGSASNDGGQLDSAGQAILKLLHKAAGTADANSRRALETAQKLSSQLEAAKDRIVGLEAELQLYREKADRAEEWLSKITTEIEDRLVNQPEEKRRLRRGDHKHEFEL